MFQITKQQLLASNRHFGPVAVGRSPTAVSASHTSVVIDATKCPGVELVAAFYTATAPSAGTARVAATQIVTETVSIDFEEVLPLFWMASVLRNGDIAPNQMTQPYSGPSDSFDLAFSGQLTLSYQQGVWQIPNYDSDSYSVSVGFGIGAGLAAWGYSVLCQPGQNVPLAAGGYQLVRPSSIGNIGDPIPADATLWSMQLGQQYSLAFDASGQATLIDLSG